jgi:hypothetical protein
MSEMITVSKAYFLAIEGDSEFLQVLDAHKVHEWSGYDAAYYAYEEEKVQMDGEEYGYEG